MAETVMDGMTPQRVRNSSPLSLNLRRGEVTA
jgi:hypothetical protein